jgi:small subunit ribosomal protein S17
MSKELRKVRTGRVVSDKMDKTVVVAVQWSQRNRLYRKPMRRITKFYAHDAANDCSTGDLVRIEETRPISRLKNWRVIDVIERREVAEVRPMELDRAFMESQMRGQDVEAQALEEAVADEPQSDVTQSEAEAEAEALALEEAVAELEALEQAEEPAALDVDEETIDIEPHGSDDVPSLRESPQKENQL